MSSRREVLIRILALLQRKTLIETKNRTLKCLKRHSSTVRSIFFRPHRGGFDSSRVPTPGNFPSKTKQNANARGSAGRGKAGRSWNWLMPYVLSVTYCGAVVLKVMDQKTLVKRGRSHKVRITVYNTEIRRQSDSFYGDLFPAHRCPSAIKFKIRLECVSVNWSNVLLNS